MSEAAPVAPEPAPAGPPRRGFPWSTLFMLVVLGATLWGMAVIGQRAGRFDALVSRFQLERNNYIIRVCPDSAQLEAMPAWAEPVRDACLETEPGWGTAAPATEQSAHETLSGDEKVGLTIALGRFLRTFNPIVLLEIFVALTVAFFVLLGVRGGETPAETVLSKLGSGVRAKWIRTARQAAIVGLVLGAGSLVAGTYSAEVREERRECHDTAVSYGHLIGIDKRCATLRASLVDEKKKRETADQHVRESDDTLERCRATLASTSTAMGLQSNVKETTDALASRIANEQDASTKAVLEAINNTFKELARDVGAVRGIATQIELQAAKAQQVKDLAEAVATKAALDVVARDMATRSGQDALRTELAGKATSEAVSSLGGRLDSIADKLRALEELKARQCLQKHDLSAIESSLDKLARPAVTAK